MQLFGGNLLSKVLGLAREVLVSAFFGTGSTIGAFRVAQTGTLVPVNFFTSDSLNAAFIPLYKRYRTESPDRAQALLWSLLVMFLVLSSAIAVVLLGLSTVWVSALAPGLDAQTAETAASLLRVMALGVPSYLLSSLLIYHATALGDFRPMAYRPSLQNVGVIGGAVISYITHDPVYLAWGFTAAYFGLLCALAIDAVRKGRLAFPSSPSGVGWKNVLGTFWATLRPLLLLPVLLQGNIAIERAVATVISLTAVSALDYARYLAETVIFLLSVPVASAGLSLWSATSTERLNHHLIRAATLLLIVSVPISAFLVAHAHVVVAVVYGRGAFTTDSIQSTELILGGMAVGLWAQVVGYILLKALNVQLRNRTVLLVMAVGLVANTVVNVSFHRLLGPLALGLGNAAYGLGLFAGTAWALGLLRDLTRALSWLALGAVGYFTVGLLVPTDVNKWIALAYAMLFSIAFWTSWVLGVPLFRRLLLSTLRRREV